VNNTVTWPHTHTARPIACVYLLEKQSDFNNKPLLVQLQNLYQTIFFVHINIFFFLFSFSGKKNNILLVEVRHRRPFANDSTIKPVLSCFWKLNATSPSIQSTEQQNYSSTTEQSYDQHFTNTVHQLTANKCLISAMFLRKGFFS